MQQISCKVAAPTMVATRNSVKVGAVKGWQKATATVLSTAVVAAVALPAIAADDFLSDPELLARVKTRVCVENPTAQICIPKRTEVYDALLQELKQSEAGQ